MIKKLDIENFMLFKKLEVSTLKRVNLIGGRNNSGKTTFLDALRIFVSNIDTGILNDVLQGRQLFQSQSLDRFSALFPRGIEKINPFIKLKLNDLSIDKGINSNGYNSYKVTNFNSYKQEEEDFNLTQNTNPSTLNEKCVYIPFYSNFKMISDLWEKVVLTPKEDDVLDIIRETVEPKLKRFDVGKNIVRIRLEDTIEPVPLGTLGDGVQRILLIALSLANAKNSYLLIDEIELGLHHSVLEKLWKMIFKYAKKWNIQVFVTTHSQDALRTFSYVASEEENKAEAQFIRLQIGRTGENEAILFDTDQLNNTLELELEIR